MGVGSGLPVVEELIIYTTSGDVLCNNVYVVFPSYLSRVKVN